MRLPHTIAPHSSQKTSTLFLAQSTIQQFALFATYLDPPRASIVHLVCSRWTCCRLLSRKWAVSDSLDPHKTTEVQPLSRATASPATAPMIRPEKAGYRRSLNTQGNEAQSPKVERQWDWGVHPPIEKSIPASNAWEDPQPLYQTLGPTPPRRKVVPAPRRTSGCRSWMVKGYRG